MATELFILAALFGAPALLLLFYWIEREQDRRDFLAGKPLPTHKDTP